MKYEVFMEKYNATKTFDEVENTLEDIVDLLNKQQKRIEDMKKMLDDYRNRK